MNDIFICDNLLMDIISYSLIEGYNIQLNLNRIDDKNSKLNFVLTVTINDETEVDIVDTEIDIAHSEDEFREIIEDKLRLSILARIRHFRLSVAVLQCKSLWELKEDELVLKITDYIDFEKCVAECGVRKSVVNFESEQKELSQDKQRKKWGF